MSGGIEQCEARLLQIADKERVARQGLKIGGIGVLARSGTFATH
jgi:hypothetical protein